MLLSVPEVFFEFLAIRYIWKIYTPYFQPKLLKNCW